MYTSNHVHKYTRASPADIRVEQRKQNRVSACTVHEDFKKQK